MAYAIIKFLFRQDNIASDEIGSGGVPAGADPDAIGYNRVVGSRITCTDTQKAYLWSGVAWEQQLNVDSTFEDAADLQDMVTEIVIAPDADAVAAIHAGFAGDDVSNDFPGPFTNPDVPRGLSFTFGAGWDGGDITPVGTDIDDAPCTEVITNPGAGGGAVQSLKVYKTVTAATKGAAGVNAATCSIDSWHKLGLLNAPSVMGGIVSVAGVTEQAAWDNLSQCKGFTPTTVPDGAVNFDAEFPKAGATSVVTATP